ncbi:MAG: D-alanyl-D-alanine carboxypeptidase/D-alanyl-D-alanine-endopeptidase [Bacteroidetes bacterium]|nr:D-alanyl-D-alanine carboxypeptidase/D-alanyl-D-alanine-endopeptidase [Bacteroidota bacterium]MBU1113991.1 D-alanyl-D-alanine carboxypeptidase/D-alanyl-D-alanine-endopeptidase [Bacteroidota bacterium]MBU1799811.1 D-alanyl-D-alanine carboxypeptidase/D-alanyl-D-alanine-endopeptidase [Bacteroidota bacterium]
MRKMVVILIVVIQTLNFGQEKKFTTTDELTYLLKNPFFRRCQIGVDAYNISKKEIVFRHNEKLLFRPASNMKIITTAAALRFLGPDYNFTTQIKYAGEIINGVLNGNLYFVGGFDPDFTSADLDTMIIKLKDKGINKIIGNIYVDVSNMDSLDWGLGWMWDDEPSYDFPHMTPLPINNASLQVAISPSKIGEKVVLKTIPESNYFKYTNNIFTVDNDTSNLVLSRDWINYSDSLIFEGGLFVGAEPDTITINLKNTNQYFLTLAKEALDKNKIIFEGKCGVESAPPEAKTIVTKQRNFGKVIVNLNKTSDNLSAEMTLRALAFNEYGKLASAEKGVEVIDSLIVEVGLNPEDYRIVDGSGVSHYNLVSVELLNEILRYMQQYHPELFSILYESFPIAGVDGTLDTRMNEGRAYKNVHAKTGTLSGVSSLSGYLTSKSGDLISFSINTQNFIGSTRTARYFQDKICEILSNME